MESNLPLLESELDFTCFTNRSDAVWFPRLSHESWWYSFCFVHGDICPCRQKPPSKEANNPEATMLQEKPRLRNEVLNPHCYLCLVNANCFGDSLLLSAKGCCYSKCTLFIICHLVLRLCWCSSFLLEHWSAGTWSSWHSEEHHTGSRY